MSKLNRISIIEEYQTEKEKRENLEVELYKFLLSIGNRKATYDELKQEVEYRKRISECQYKQNCLKDEIKLIAGVKAGLAIIGLTVAAIIALSSAKCAKDKNAHFNDSSIIEETVLEDNEVLIKTLH